MQIRSMIWPSWAARDRGFADAVVFFLQPSEQLVDHPVRGQLAVAALRHGLEIGGVVDVGGQHAGVVFGHAVVGDEARLLGVGQFGQAGGDVVDPGLFDLQRQQVGAGEVAIVMRLFLGPHASAFRPCRDRTAGFPDRSCRRPRGWRSGGAPRYSIAGLDEAHRVHVLDLAAGAEMAEILGFLIAFIVAGAADGDVDVGAQVAVLHVAVAGAQIAQDLAQFHDIGGGLFGAANVRARRRSPSARRRCG